jgi:D-3-phosphoglycerate dehydrogenase / 2-oxoglutarate reductase
LQFQNLIIFDILTVALNKMKLKDKYLIIDFDSTLVKLEGLEVLAEITLEGRDDAEQILHEIKATTDKGMSGSITFRESLSERLKLFQPNRDHIDKLTELLLKNITKSVLKNKKYFSNNYENIFVVSGGFEEWILPITRILGINDDNVLANKFYFDEQGRVVGFDQSNPLTQDKGKALSVKSLGLTGEVIIIGTDLPIMRLKLKN